MENHVFAVWDFQCLVKTIKVLSTSENPRIWTRPKIPYNSLRLINEIILGEETDILPDGNYASHLDMYILAMKEVGANTEPIEAFLHKAAIPYLDVDLALVPSPAKEFVAHTLSVIGTRKLHIILSNFTYGRELMIPEMFTSLLNDLELEAPMFRYYLNRHIQLDSEDHGPSALQLIQSVVGDDLIKQQEVEQAKEHALLARERLWKEIT
jgi:hypothetical protein